MKVLIIIIIIMFMINSFLTKMIIRLIPGLNLLNHLKEC
jgi:hypothetical protein